MNPESNPFPGDPDRRQLWDMLVRRDIDAFTACDWNAVAHDFDTDAFHGTDARGSDNPDTWKLAYPTLADYRDAWLQQHRELASHACNLREDLYRATFVRDIDITGDRAVVHKKFDGRLTRIDDSPMRLNWQTLYLCRKHQGRWLITGFIGYLPNTVTDAAGPPMTAAPRALRVPPDAGQHTTAGPYSPVIEVTPGKLVVISGQGAITPDGSVTPGGIREQTHATLDNCRRQLRHAGADFADVFKVNVYLRDLSDWPAFNDAYAEVMPQPLPVRTAVGADLLLTLRVELEMWAVLP